MPEHHERTRDHHERTRGYHESTHDHNERTSEHNERTRDLYESARDYHDRGFGHHHERAREYYDRKREYYHDRTSDIRTREKIEYNEGQRRSEAHEKQSNKHSESQHDQIRNNYYDGGVHVKSKYGHRNEYQQQHSHHQHKHQHNRVRPTTDTFPPDSIAASGEPNPKVFIVEENKTHSPLDSNHNYQQHNQHQQKPSDAGSKSPTNNNHTIKSWVQYTPSHSERSNTQYKHWHNYSIDKLAHNNRESHDNDIPSSLYKFKLDTPESIASIKSAGLNGSSEDLTNSSKSGKHFLELKFDHHQPQQHHHHHQYPAKSTCTSHHDNTTSTASNASVTTTTTPRSHSSLPVGTPLEEKKIWCLACDCEVTKKLCGHSNLVVQEREKEFPCPTCHRIFNNRSHLKRHNMIHSGEKPWACTYCDKRFNRKSHLNRHVLTHTGERPFK